MKFALLFTALLFISSCTQIPEGIVKKTSDKHIILIHGFNSDSEIWAPIMEDMSNALNADVSVFNYDTSILFFGNDYQAPLTELALDLKAYIEPISKKHDEIHVIAHSNGGLIVKKFLSLMENKPVIKTVTLLGTPSFGTNLATFGKVLTLGLGSVELDHLEKNNLQLLEVQKTLFHLKHKLPPILSIVGTDDEVVDVKSALMVTPSAINYLVKGGHSDLYKLIDNLQAYSKIKQFILGHKPKSNLDDYFPDMKADLYIHVPQLMNTSITVRGDFRPNIEPQELREMGFTLDRKLSRFPERKKISGRTLSPKDLVPTWLEMEKRNPFKMGKQRNDPLDRYMNNCSVPNSDRFFAVWSKPSDRDNNFLPQSRYSFQWKYFAHCLSVYEIEDALKKTGYDSRIQRFKFYSNKTGSFVEETKGSFLQMVEAIIRAIGDDSINTYKLYQEIEDKNIEVNNGYLVVKGITPIPNVFLSADIAYYLSLAKNDWGEGVISSSIDHLLSKKRYVEIPLEKGINVVDWKLN